MNQTARVVFHRGFNFNKNNKLRNYLTKNSD
nr:MAG TPA: hypothetical protein [Caudoviricetes sp.]